MFFFARTNKLIVIRSNNPIENCRRAPYEKVEERAAKYRRLKVRCSSSTYLTKRKHRDHKLIYTVQQGSVSEKSGVARAGKRRLIFLSQMKLFESIHGITTASTCAPSVSCDISPWKYEHFIMENWNIFQTRWTTLDESGRTLKLFSSPSANKKQTFPGKTSSAITIQSHWRAM